MKKVIVLVGLLLLLLSCKEVKNRERLIISYLKMNRGEYVGEHYKPVLTVPADSVFYMGEIYHKEKEALLKKMELFEDSLLEKAYNNREKQYEKLTKEEFKKEVFVDLTYMDEYRIYKEQLNNLSGEFVGVAYKHLYKTKDEEGKVIADSMYVIMNPEETMVTDSYLNDYEFGYKYFRIGYKKKIE